MKKTLQILFVAAIVISASANGREIAGQVFIVTKAHESVKLALVSISIHPRDQVQSVKEAVDSELKSDREQTAKLASSLNQAYQAASQAGDRLWKDAMASSPRDTNLFKAVGRARNLAKDILRLETLTLHRSHFLLGSAPYFRKLNELYRPVASTKSDADGKFSISVPDTGEFAITAYAERRTFDKTEEYFWVVPVADKIDLSNDNLTSATSGASLLHALGNDDLADATGTSDAIQVEFDQIKNKYADIFPAVAASVPPRAPPRFVTLNQAVSVQLQYGTVVLPAGTRLELVSQDALEVHVRYNNSEQAIPVGAVDSR